MRAILLVLFATGCNQILGVGDPTLDIDGGHVSGDAPDARTIDGMQIDATPAPTRAASIYVIDATLVDPEVAALGVSITGGAIGIHFQDTSGGNGMVLSGTSPINGCQLIQFDPSHPGGTLLDAGPVSITGAALRKTVGPCNDNFDPDGDGLNDYACVSAASATTFITVAGDTTTGTVTYTLLPGTINGQSLVGAWFQIGGFSNSALNGFFPILTTQNDNVTVYNPSGASAGSTSSPTASFKVVNGWGPAPGTAASNDFIGNDATQSVEISKGAGPAGSWSAFDVTMPAQGDGFHLDGASADPANLPSPAMNADAVFSCADTTTGGNCGTATSAPLQGTIVFANTTNESTTGYPPFSMPPATTTSIIKQLQCAYLGSTTATIPAAVIQQMWANGTTRIETQVARVAAAQITDASTNTGAFVVVGHALVGHTDPN